MVHDSLIINRSTWTALVTAVEALLIVALIASMVDGDLGTKKIIKSTFYVHQWWHITKIVIIVITNVINISPNSHVVCQTVFCYDKPSLCPLTSPDPSSVSQNKTYLDHSHHQPDRHSRHYNHPQNNAWSSFGEMWKYALWLKLLTEGNFHPLVENQNCTRHHLHHKNKKFFMPETLDPLRTDHCRLANVSEWKPEPDSGCCSARVTADTAHWADFSNTTEAGNNFFFGKTSKLAKTNVSGTIPHTCKCLCIERCEG